MSLILQGSTSGSITLQEPAVAGTTVLDLPATSGTLFVTGQSSAITSGTSVASTSGTSIDFTGIPSWVKRITVNFNGVSTNGTSGTIVRLGTGGTPTTSGYNNMVGVVTTTNNTTRGTIYTTSFGLIHAGTASDSFCGALIFSLLNSNVWTLTGSSYNNTQAAMGMTAGTVSLAGVLNLVRITTVNGTDTFDAGTINILYE